eukprot:TRINITY_DN58404_c0_g1_i1.p1 TRINITY_DN58404_c0_g1~~TRINITY_DN58404_c0_g1_i1.p1  ORF type:complete len:304 (+),score=47.67 TRINITY_DN58404_c0_g1_i1:46-957(+)
MAEFEWILGFEELKQYLDPKQLNVDGGAALIVGCGRSSLSKDLKLGGFFEEVISLDYDPVVIETMRQAEPSLQWICADCCSEEAMAGALDAARFGKGQHSLFDAVIDKGTMDAVLCEDEKVAGLLCECYRALKPGGVYICVSLRDRCLLDRLLGAESPCDWSYDASPVTTKGVRGQEHVFTVALLRRPVVGGVQPDLNAMREHCAASLNVFFADEVPLLTPEREASIRLSFETCLQETSSLNLKSHETGLLPLRSVYTLLFTDVEKEEYKLEDFLEDVASGEGREDAEHMSLEEALVFMKANQ